MDNNLQPVPPLKPFRRFVMQNFPFIEKDFQDLDSYGLWCKVVEYLNKTIDSQNEVTAQMEYILNYFNNLNVQEEIDNKLDEMAESGELADIIAAYIQLRGVLAYNTVAEMKSADNLVAGSFAETYGFYAKGDGGSAKYKIREITNEDIVDNIFLFALSNSETLVAELVVNEDMNVKQFGVKSDGTTDNTSILNTVIASGVTSLYFPDGEYLVNSVINIGSVYNIKGQSKRYTIIKAPSGFITWTGSKNTLTISDIRIDGVSINSNNGIKGVMMSGVIKNVRIEHYENAILFDEGTWINTLSELIILNCTNGIAQSAGKFNNNNIENCMIQYCTGTAISAYGDQNSIVGCDIEFCGNAFAKIGKLCVIDKCYIEKNTYVFNATIATPAEASLIIKNSWLEAIDSGTQTGWLVYIPTKDDATGYYKDILIENCRINNKATTNKPFAFNTLNNGCAWSISLKENFYVDCISSGLITYTQLFDKTNCPKYGTPACQMNICADIPLYQYDHLRFWRDFQGNKQQAGRSNVLIRVEGYVLNSQSEGNVVITPDEGWGLVYPQNANVPVMLLWNNGTYELARATVTNENITITPNYNSRRLASVRFNIAYGNYLS